MKCGATMPGTGTSRSRCWLTPILSSPARPQLLRTAGQKGTYGRPHPADGARNPAHPAAAGGVRGAPPARAALVLVAAAASSGGPALPPGAPEAPAPAARRMAAAGHDGAGDGAADRGPLGPAGPALA